MPKKQVIIIGAGPAGLTAAFELLKESNEIEVHLLEADTVVGGISRTVNYKGNRIDIGGHRFFSKSDWVMNWWRERMPISASEDLQEIKYQGQTAKITGDKAPEKLDNIMLLRSRLSRIFFLRKFFDYPISMSVDTFLKLGPIRISKILASYSLAKLFPIKNEQNLEEFFINRFGKELYLTFFKDYTEKVWGVACKDIPAEWGAQRIKGISISKTIKHALKKNLKKSDQNIAQKGTETSLIERFLYPKLGPGQMWEITLEEILKMGGKIHYQQKVSKINYSEDSVTSIESIDPQGNLTKWEGSHFISTMPVKDLIAGMGNSVPQDVQNIASALAYRDFITVGLLVPKLKIKDPDGTLVKDNWIYIQEREVKVGRLQIFNNWSPYLVKDPNKVWIGLEYFVQEGDELWQMKDQDLSEFATKELQQIDILPLGKPDDAVVIRVPKTYPSYIGAYEQFDTIREFVDPIHNLFLVGRNGQHRYNNQDHSMLSAYEASKQILSGQINKNIIWSVNTEKEYHEEKKEP